MALYLFVRTHRVVEAATNSIGRSELGRSGGAGFWRAGSVAPGVRHEDGVFPVRQGPWKLVVDELGSGGFSEPRRRCPAPGEPGGQPYDLAEDPGERRDL